MRRPDAEVVVAAIRREYNFHYPQRALGVEFPLFSLSSLQLAVVIDAARPLSPNQRGRFLQRIAELLRGRPVDDDAVGRAAEVARREF